MTVTHALRGRTRYPGLVDANSEAASVIFSTPDLLQWYDASKIRGKVSGDHITALADQSGNGNNLTSGVGPVYRPFGMNGLPSMEFNGGSQYLGGSGRIVPLTNISMFLVLTYSGGRAIGLENSGSGAHGLAWYQKSLWIIRNSGATNDLNISGAPATAIHSLLLGTGGANAKYNASSDITGAGTAYSDASVNFQLGSSGNPGGEIYVGHIAEFVSYNRKLSTTERDAIHAALNLKYAIY